jgi:hypothetical protein
MHTAEPLVLDPSFSELEIAIEIWEGTCKSPRSDQIPGEILRSKVNNLINSVANKENLPDHWKEFSSQEGW